MTDAAEQSGEPAGTPPATWCDALEAEYRALYAEPALPPGAPSDPLERLAAVSGRMHERHASALCLSGGGIRSATFALGVLQGLAHAGVLGSFDYLSTVSGGGYTGGWFTAWLRRAGQKEVLDALDPAQARLDNADDQARYEASPVERVRLTCRYLALQGGVVSADVWTLIVTMARNLVLNWFVVLPLIGAALLIPRLYYAAIRGIERGAGPGELLAAHASTSWFMVAAFVLFAIGTGYLILNFTGHGAQWSQQRFLAFCLAPFLGGTIAMTLFWAEFPALMRLPAWLMASAAVPTLAWIVLGLLTPRIFRRVPRSDGSTLRVHVGLRTILAAAAAGPVLGAGAYWFRMVYFGPNVLGQDYAVQAVPFFLGLVLLQITLFIGFASSEQDDAVLEWWSRCGAWLAIAAAMWLAAGLLVFAMPDLIEVGLSAVGRMFDMEHSTSSGLLAIVVPLISSLAGMAARSGGRPGQPSLMRTVFSRVGLPLVIFMLLSTMAWVNVRALAGLEYHQTNGVRCTPDTMWEGGECHPAGAGLGEVALLGAILTTVALVMSALVPVNRFSLHGMYRQRIIRTFLGASRSDRHPNKFTGFDANDDLFVHNLAAVRPLHVINTTLNAVRSTNVGRSEIDAQSFTFTPLHVGTRSLGYRAASQYGSDGGEEGTGLSLGMALAVSGAAASPAMGIYSTKSRAFLLTLANARLGLWFGNPSDEKTWQESEPALGIQPLTREMLGLTTDKNPFVYLSDGGHYENLGLWEMVSRRCRFIVVSDAGCDPKYTFDDLSNAVRRIRIDLGIPIQFGELGISKAGQGRTNAHGALGVIRYSIVDGPAAPDGVILYIKATLSGDEPVDVINFAALDPQFPHDSTADQFFDEARFESYRVLGFHSVLSLRGEGATAPTVEGLCEAARRSLAAHRPGVTTPTPPAA
jgi:hypothetical protein